jgi:uncharacterized alkaline shock family protein YloU
MKQAAFILGLSVQVLLVAVGLVGLLSTWLDPVSPLDRPSSSAAVWIARLGWTVVLLTPAARAAVLWWILRAERSIVIRASGSVSLSLHQAAVVQYIRNALDEIEELRGHRVRVAPAGRNRVTITIEITLAPVADVPAVQERIQRIIVEKVTALLGAGRLAKTRVIVRGFTAGPRAARKAESEDEIEDEREATPPYASFDDVEESLPSERRSS